MNTDPKPQTSAVRRAGRRIRIVQDAAMAALVVAGLAFCALSMADLKKNPDGFDAALLAPAAVLCFLAALAISGWQVWQAVKADRVKREAYVAALHARREAYALALRMKQEAYAAGVTLNVPPPTKTSRHLAVIMPITAEQSRNVGEMLSAVRAVDAEYRSEHGRDPFMPAALPPVRDLAAELVDRGDGWHVSPELLPGTQPGQAGDKA